MTYNELPVRWKEKLAIYLQQLDCTRNPLSSGDFKYKTHIIFDDNSVIQFNYSFYLEVPEFEEIAVFTEHCGYHIFKKNSIHSIKSII